jgi:hypothetical protein
VGGGKGKAMYILLTMKTVIKFALLCCENCMLMKILIALVEAVCTSETSVYFNVTDYTALHLRRL